MESVGQLAAAVRRMWRISRAFFPKAPKDSRTNGRKVADREAARGLYFEIFVVSADEAADSGVTEVREGAAGWATAISIRRDRSDIIMSRSGLCRSKPTVRGSM